MKNNLLSKLPILSLILLSLIFSRPGQASTLPGQGEASHLGVASCASGVCHGSVRTRTATRIPQNEYVIWSKLDHHRNAFKTLLSEESAAIAYKLGLANAYEADVCLDCHADNVPEERRGDRFQLSDGVGCEACHGGSEHYISSHTDPGASHLENVERGLYPLDEANSRAKLCLGCHMGTDKKIASHEIMGAGHPRLSFELDTFTALQPAHYVIDADYRENKSSPDSVTVWVIGQLQAARQTLELLSTHFSTGALFPELSLFDCHACHHDMSDQRWRVSDQVKLPPGAVRLNNASFVMLSPIARAFAPAEIEPLKIGLENLNLAAYSGESFVDTLDMLQASLDNIETSLTQSEKISVRLLKDLISIGEQGAFRDYVEAEQAVLAIDLLLSETDQRDATADWVERLYISVESEREFNPESFLHAISNNRPAL